VLFYANSYAASSPVQAQWALLTWTWKVVHHSVTTYQRITVITLNGASDLAGFPVPAAPATNGDVLTTFTGILRGASSPVSPAPARATVNRLRQFSRAVVSRQAAELAR